MGFNFSFFSFSLRRHFLLLLFFYCFDRFSKGEDFISFSIVWSSYWNEWMDLS
jgi:hypothetical protein